MIPRSKHRIVILGAGFAGVACARTLAQLSAGAEFEITIVDAATSQLYQPALYEILCTPRAVSAAALKQIAQIPLADAFRWLPVNVRQGRVTFLDGKNRVVHLDHGQLAYDTLVIALGSQSEYFGVAGAEKYAWAFRSFEDAVRFRNALADEFGRSSGEPITVVISGGGFAGVECAGELACLLRRLERQSGRSGHVVVVEGCPQLLPGLPTRVAQFAHRRLEFLGVEIRLNTLAVRISAREISLSSKEQIKTKFVLWTAGVRACPLPGAGKDVCGPRGRLSTNPSLHLAGFPNVFAIGDVACIAGSDGKPLPQTASLAIDEAQYVARSIVAEHRKQKSVPYQPHFEGYVIPVGGKYALFVFPSGFVIAGFLGWVLRRLIDLVYLSSVLPWSRALLLWLKANRLFTRND